ncbi:hypothetical protein [Actinacidiphila acidipaludis]|uniref:Uncharacterized protein n=1 Tax=Actinacidiphila acidipaludis TaxID=2873382 RepID=A0ABS7QEF8_9ACTN|nr:hypothetical protein [Streptomyces acidipaludis]MBY8881546.1 hypothetical protein [Streptomyces acidipaludis]
MADEFGPTKPAGPDPVDERLRQLARETEPLVVLAGPAAARRRGEHRRARRRAGAACLVAALALGVGSWQLLPRLGSGRTGTQPAATAPAPASSESLADRLQRELLPPSALPLYPKRQWEVVPEQEATAKYPESCPVSRVPTYALAKAERVYRTSQGFVARYYLFAMPSAAAAATEASEFDALIKGKCGWAVGIDGAATPDRSVFPSGSAYRGQASALWVDRQGTYLAFLDVSTLAGYDGKDSFSGSGPRPALCIQESLERLSSNRPWGGSSPGDEVPPASPSTPEAPPQGSAAGPGAGSGSGTSANAPRGSALPGTTPTPAC